MPKKVRRNSDDIPPTFCERQRDRETERQRDREAERQRDRETERQRDRETERQRDRQRDRETERRRDRETERQRDRQTEREKKKRGRERDRPSAAVDEAREGREARADMVDDENDGCDQHVGRHVRQNALKHPRPHLDG